MKHLSFEKLLDLIALTIVYGFASVAVLIWLPLFIVCSPFLLFDWAVKRSEEIKLRKENRDELSKL